VWQRASRCAAAPADDSNNGVRRGPDRRQHPRPQHPPTPDVDRLEHRLYRPPSAGGGQFWLVLAGDAAVDGGDPLPANSCTFVGPEDPAFAGASGPVGAELLCLQFRRRAQD